eukprot:GEMP01013633.1.p1 GENE.GEMP01013633.1~~GEMP01013633.1.p1  ORF type:complete len:444 (+),score=91.62 GEMP01013633.1:1046-2377(+)
MRGSPVVTDPSIPDDYKPILIGEDGSHTVLGRDIPSKDGMSDTWALHGGDASSVDRPTMSPYAEEFVPGWSSGETYFRKRIKKLKKRPDTTVNKKFEIVYDIQIQHDPEYNVFPIVRHIEGPDETRMLNFVHMASGALELRLRGPPLHLVVGADSADVFEEGKELVEEHLRKVYKAFMDFANFHNVAIDRPLRVRSFREKRPDQPYRDESEFESDVESEAPLIDEKRFLDQLDSAERRLESPRASLSRIDEPYYEQHQVKRQPVDLDQSSTVSSVVDRQRDLEQKARFLSTGFGDQHCPPPLAVASPLHVRQFHHERASRPFDYYSRDHAGNNISQQRAADYGPPSSETSACKGFRTESWLAYPTRTGVRQLYGSDLPHANTAGYIDPNTESALFAAQKVLEQTKRRGWYNMGIDERGGSGGRDSLASGMTWLRRTGGGLPLQ